MKLSDARVLITGGGTGIGRALAAHLVEAGAKVAVSGRRQEPLDEAAAELGVLAVQGDVSVEADAVRVVQTVVDAWGGFNTLINNAGFGTFAKLLDTTLEDMERVFATNVGGAMLMARESARHFIATDTPGTIVNIASTAANTGFTGGTVYAASKFALTGMTECWRAELRPHDIRVMQVNPSEVQTPFNGKEQPARNESKLQAEDCAHLIASLLALHDRGFVTDATLWATNPK